MWITFLFILPSVIARSEPPRATRQSFGFTCFKIASPTGFARNDKSLVMTNVGGRRHDLLFLFFLKQFSKSSIFSGRSI